MSHWIVFALGFVYGAVLCWLVFQAGYALGLLEWRGAATKGDSDAR